MFTAPWQAGEWHDSNTGRLSVSLGRNEYSRVLKASGLLVAGDDVDEGENYYYLTRKAPEAH